MVPTRKRQTTLFVDRSSQRWVVRDAEGKLWLLPSMADAWNQRVPFEPTEEMDLEMIPGHYKQMLGLPQ